MSGEQSMQQLDVWVTGMHAGANMLNAVLAAGVPKCPARVFIQYGSAEQLSWALAHGFDDDPNVLLRMAGSIRDHEMLDIIYARYLTDEV
jgi:hypothetical protein